MNYYIRQAVAEDYDDINSLIKDIHNIEYDNRPDVYLDEDNKNGRDHFIERVESRKGLHTIEASKELGFGTTDYELIEIN